eukprot:1144615-Pelagomonas_calceolata.AAC.2
MGKRLKACWFHQPLLMMNEAVTHTDVFWAEGTAPLAGFHTFNKKRKDYASQVSLCELRKGYLTSKLARVSTMRLTGPA